MLLIHPSKKTCSRCNHIFYCPGKCSKDIRTSNMCYCPLCVEATRGSREHSVNGYYYNGKCPRLLYNLTDPDDWYLMMILEEL